MRRAALLTTAALLLSLVAGEAAAQSFDSMVVFGDSLSDNGNVAATLGLPRMRFTTNPGLVAVEDIGARFGVTLEPSTSGGTDYAYGGAGLLDNEVQGVPKAPEQIDSYLSAHPQADPNGLYAIWGGNNDVFFNSARIVAGAETLDQANARITAAAQLEGALIDRLQAAGVRRLIVFALPDIGLTPGGLPHDTVMVQTFNATLNAELAGRHGVVPVNMFALFHETVANPGAAGFSNTTERACTVSTSLLCTPATLAQPDAASTFVFADDVHPTTAAHKAVADVVISELTAPGQMSLLAEAPLSLLRDHRAAVRSELDRATTSKEGVTLFATGQAGVARLGGDLDAPTSHSDIGALTVGGVWSSEGLSLGGALTFAENRVKLQGGLGGFKAKEFAGSIFGQYLWPDGSWTSAQAGLGGANYDDIARSFVIGRGGRTERSSSSGKDLSLELAGGHWFDIGGLRTGPFAALSYDRVRVGEVVETSADSTAMWFAAQTREAVVSRIGWTATGAATLGGWTVRPIGSIAYAHDFRADRRDVTAGLTTFNGDFSMPGYQPSRNWAEAKLGLEADLGRGLTGRLSYEGLYGGRGAENLGALSIAYAF